MDPTSLAKPQAMPVQRSQTWLLEHRNHSPSSDPLYTVEVHAKSPLPRIRRQQRVPIGWSSTLSREAARPKTLLATPAQAKVEAATTPTPFPKVSLRDHTLWPGPGSTR